jgi:LacI family transcriptional regulator
MKKFRVALFFDLSRQYDRDVMQGIINFSHHIENWEFFYETPHYLSDYNSAKHIRKIIQWKPDGIIARSLEGWQNFLDLNVPLIISPHYEKIEGVTSIYSDNYLIGDMAAKEFIRRGYKNFGFFGDRNFFWSNNRKKAFQLAVARVKGTYFSIPQEISELPWENQPKELAKWLLEQTLPIAIMGASDEYGQLLTEAVRLAGLKSPDDVVIIGVDNDTFICELSYPSLSSIDQDAERGGYLAAKVLNDMMKSKTMITDHIICYPRNLIRRKSSDEYATVDTEVKKALDFIGKEAVSRSISVTNVVNITRLSRRSLENRFLKQLNKPIYEYIRQVRLEVIKTLLITSNKTIKEIAFELDFNSVETVSRFFKNETGITPSEFRKNSG